MSTTTRQRRLRFDVPMEGVIARWYTRLRGSAPQIEEYRAQAAELTDGLAGGADVLEVAPGPGYLAIELARGGQRQVTGLDISHTFVDIATAKARQAGVRVDFRHGDAARMPFDTGSFDVIVCQAAFKNFRQPVSALNEMHRVLRSGGWAVIQDMRSTASDADIAREVERMELGRLNAFMTTRTLHGLRRRAYSPAQFEGLAARSAFGSCEIHTEGVGLEVRLHKLGDDGSHRDLYR
jgi:ubiquinone/menaquinone biosynthesis C-methylase UbiE